MPKMQYSNIQLEFNSKSKYQILATSPSANKLAAATQPGEGNFCRLCFDINRIVDTCRRAALVSRIQSGAVAPCGLVVAAVQGLRLLFWIINLDVKSWLFSVNCPGAGASGYILLVSFFLLNKCSYLISTGGSLPLAAFFEGGNLQNGVA